MEKSLSPKILTSRNAELTPLIQSPIDFNGEGQVGKRQFRGFKTLVGIQVSHFLESLEYMQMINDHSCAL